MRVRAWSGTSPIVAGTGAVIRRGRPRRKVHAHDEKQACGAPSLQEREEKNKDTASSSRHMSRPALGRRRRRGERSNPWLAERRGDVRRINPAARTTGASPNGEQGWVTSPRARSSRPALVRNESIARRVAAVPLLGRGGSDLLQYYPGGAAPMVRGEAVNTATTYGYDSVTMMQETKTTVCQVERAAA